jgi:hypothetical protein
LSTSSSPSSPRAVVLLGAQRFDPTLADAVSDLGVKGAIATITAGWQEREDEDDDLEEHLSPLGVKTINLRLHARADDFFRGDLEFHKAHRDRQALLRHRQDFYRIRLEHALEAERVISHRAAPDAILEDEAHASIEAIRDLDDMHLSRCARDRGEFDDKWKPHEREGLARHRKEIADIVKSCEAIAIAGGHVASLLNRLDLFGIADLVGGKNVFAWCGGAMVISDRVVLFHDSPPQGFGAAEVLDAGLGIAPGVVVLPQPEFRLRTDDRDRVQVLARRFDPSLCVAMPSRSRMEWKNGKPENASGGVFQLREDGLPHSIGEPGVRSSSHIALTPAPSKATSVGRMRSREKKGGGGTGKGGRS